MRVLLCAALALALAAQDDPINQAVSALQGGDLASAERILQTHLATHPNDGVALEVMGAVLDQAKKFSEADDVYRRALQITPQSPGLLNNYGNHLLSVGKPKEAQAAFAKVLALDPKHANAAVQMTRLALEQHAPADANRYLARLPADVANRPDVMLLRLRADYGLHRTAEADALVAQVSKTANAQQTFALAEALSAAGQYAKAEDLFASTLKLQPQNFDALYDLGLAAAHAGHAEHAGEVLEQALAQQPENPGVLYDLAAVDLTLQRGEASLELLARARKLAPDRADVQLLLARTAAQLGYFGDAVDAWQSYLKLKPDDEIAQREHAFAEMALPINADAALAELRAFTRKHPGDPTGHYELGVAESPTDPDHALPEITRTLTLKPQFPGARLVRGLLLYKQGQLQPALADFEKAAAEDPTNPAVLERLGQTYLALDRANDALRVLRQAARIAPDNAGVLLQLGRALTKAGEEQEAAKTFARYRELAPAQRALPHPAGLVDFLSLSPTEQLTRYRAGVERTVEKNPENVEAQVRYLGLLLADGKIAEAEPTVRKIDALQPNVATLADAAQLLLNAEQFRGAREILQHAAERGITSAELQLDLALTIDHLDGPDAALEAMNHIDNGGRTGDYFLALGQVLEESQHPAQAEQAFDSAFRLNPQRAPLYRSVALLLLEHDRLPRALDVLDRAIQHTPDDPQPRALKAIALALSGKSSTTEFQQMEDRWPGWAPVWLAHACVLSTIGDINQAKTVLDTAQSLGASGAAVDFCSAEINRRSGPLSDGRAALRKALQLLFR